jgi:hypothetical protein
MDRQRGHGAGCQRENDASEDEYFHDQPPVVEDDGISGISLIYHSGSPEPIGRNVTAVTKYWFCGNWQQTAAPPRDVKFE